jgi:hypothetical protein
VIAQSPAYHDHQPLPTFAELPGHYPIYLRDAAASLELMPDVGRIVDPALRRQHCG